MSHGLHFKTLHMLFKVEYRIAFALPVFSLERFTIDIPTFFESADKDIFRLANITSKFVIMDILF